MWAAVLEAVRLLRDLVTASRGSSSATTYVDAAAVRQDVAAGEAARRASKGPFH